MKKKKILILSILVLVAAATSEKASHALGSRVDCTALGSYNNNGQDATAVIRNCISAASGGEVVFPPGKYTVAGRILVQGPVTLSTAGKSLSDAVCAETDASCATFVAAQESTLDQTIRAMFQFAGTNILVHHIIFDGNKDARKNSAAGRACAGGNNRPGFLLSTIASQLQFSKNVAKNALCGTGFEVIVGTDIQITENQIIANGRHQDFMMWADGITSAGVSRVTVAANVFHDNTDVQLIFGGCTDCRVVDNTFSHSSDINQSSYAELMIHTWPGGNGNYAGSIFDRNNIDCGSANNCGFGLVIGGDSWYMGTPAYDIVVHNTTIKRAMIPVDVDEATGPFEITGLNIQNTLLGSFKCWNSTTVEPTAVVNISPRSDGYMSAATRAELARLQPHFKVGAFKKREYDGCIPTPPFLAGAVPAESGSGPLPTPTPGPTPGPTPTPITENPARFPEFVSTLYRGLLEREPDSGGYAIWINHLTARTLTCPQVASGFLSSPEYLGKSSSRSNDSFITALYKGLLGRAPDPGGMNEWRNHLNTGKTRSYVESQFLISPEFRARCQ